MKLLLLAQSYVPAIWCTGFIYHIKACKDCAMAGVVEEVIVLENFIGGKFVGTPNHIDSFNPSTGKVGMLAHMHEKIFTRKISTHTHTHTHTS